MKALILAAGYATRLRPLTDSVPKQLLPVGGRPMVDWILDKIREAGIEDVHLVTNARFAADFEQWGARNGVAIHDDGTTTNETRLGAIGDIRFVQENAELDDDLVVIAGDNLFEDSLVDVIDFWSKRSDASVLAVHDVGDRELATQYGVVDVAEDARVVGFVEKPANPQSTLCATATYLYARRHAALVSSYLAEGNPADQPGHFVAWLYPRERVYAYRIAGDWYDVGDASQLLEADNRLRAAAGLPLRNAYSLD